MHQTHYVDNESSTIVAEHLKATWDSVVTPGGWRYELDRYDGRDFVVCRRNVGPIDARATSRDVVDEVSEYLRESVRRAQAVAARRRWRHPGTPILTYAQACAVYERRRRSCGPTVKVALRACEDGLGFCVDDSHRPGALRATPGNIYPHPGDVEHVSCH